MGIQGSGVNLYATYKWQRCVLMEVYISTYISANNSDDNGTYKWHNIVRSNFMLPDTKLL